MSRALEHFHPTVQRWFTSEVGAPTPAQERGWAEIAAGRHTLIAAPTGSGKTLAAFLWCLDELLKRGDALGDETRVLYVSPLKALGNDVQKNLSAPLARLRELDPTLPEVRVLVRSGDTPQSERSAMSRRPPHVLVTTPESLYILLTSAGGRRMLATVRTVIVDEIHAVLGDKRGAHLSLSLERLEALAGPVQRIGLSATQKPIEAVGRFLAGAGRESALVDEGHRRKLDLAVEIPPSPLEAVCSTETWGEIYERVQALIREHRTTLVFVGTRKLAERAAAQLTRLMGAEAIACHHSSLSKERRLDAEQRLKSGQLRALVATASLELGIDIGDVDLVVQLGTTRSIAQFLQRVGRAGHGVGRVPKGVLFPLTEDELGEAAALMRAVREGELDRLREPRGPLDILAQQLVAECAARTWREDELFALARRAWPYRELERARFDAVLALHADGRHALLHRDATLGTVAGTRRSRLTAIGSGGAIPTTTQYRVVLEPSATFVGTVDEDFAVEANVGDVFQLGNASWRVLRSGGGELRVADAHGVPPSLPFWLGEAPARTRELSAVLARVREKGADESYLAPDLPPDAVAQLAEFLRDGARALGAVPTQRRIVIERFFDESGGMQLVVHAPFGSRINRAYGLALRKRFCRHFGFELQAAANDDAILLSLGPQHSFPLDEVFEYLHPNTARDVLVQALLATPLFTTRWRWNVTRSLLVERMRNGQRIAPQILRMRADDALAVAYPEAAACGETLPPGDIPVPDDHPIVAQTIDDCLHEALDLDGLLEVLRGLKNGEIERVAIDTAEPSAFARSILNAKPYAFLDDAPLEERRTQAVYSRRARGVENASEIGALDPLAVARVREDAWPDPRDAEEVHEALSWMGFVTGEEARPWRAWMSELAAQGRIVREGERWFAVEATRDPKRVLRGRLEALAFTHDDESLLHELEREGVVLRTEIDGRAAWCERRLLARMRRYTLDTLRREIAPVSAADWQRFVAVWQCATPETRRDGPGGVLETIRQLSGFEAPLAAWEKHLFPSRIARYRGEWLDQLGLAGQVVWGRLWGAGNVALRSAPIAFFPREDAELWLGLAPAVDENAMTWPARAVLEHLRSRGASFAHEIVRASKLLASDCERGLAELVAHGVATCDSFASVRTLLRPAHASSSPRVGAGRWSLLRGVELARPEPESVALALLRRHGVLFRAAASRERQPLPWRDLARALRTLELRGDVRGGRFVEGFSGEQFASPEAIPLLRRVRRDPTAGVFEPSRHDPLQIARAATLELTGERAELVVAANETASMNSSSQTGADDDAL